MVVIKLVALNQAQEQIQSVHLAGLRRPMDLLLSLIERNQLEITTVSLVAVTDQFVAYLKTLG